MSKGTTKYVFRLDDCQKMFVDVTIARRNEFTRDEPWTLSDFIRIAIWEKLRKMERSRKHGGRKRKTLETVWG